MPRLIRTLVGLLFAALAAAPALAGKFDYLRPNAHTLTGRLDDDTEHYVPLELPAGTELSFQLRADRGSWLQPEAVLVAPDGQTIEFPSSAVNTKKGFDLRGLALGQTGEYMLILRARTRTSGNFTLKVKARYPKSAKGIVEFDDNEALEIPFMAAAGSRLKADVRRIGGGASPEAPRVVRPDGQGFTPSKVQTSKAGFRFANYSLAGALGEHRLEFSVADGSEGRAHRFKYRLKVSFPKYEKAAIVPTDLSVKPRIDLVTPTAFDREQGVVALDVFGRFIQPGAKIELWRFGESWDTATPVVSSTHIATTLDPRGRAVGRWDVIVRNGTGGEVRLRRALVVQPDAPQVTSISPTVIVDDQIGVTLSVDGHHMDGALSVKLVTTAGAPTASELTVTAVRSFGTGQRITVDVDTLRQALGHYDMVLQTSPVGDPDLVSREVRVERAFELVNAPPRVSSFAPGRTVESGPFDVVLEGAEIEADATVRLELGSEVVDVDDLAVVDGVHVTGRVDMTDAEPGRWAARVTNPDGQSALLEDVYHCTRVVTAELDQTLLGEPDIALAEEHDLALVTWLQTDEPATGTGTEWAIFGRRFSLDDEAWDGDAFRISAPGDDDVPKRDVSVAYNPVEDAWVVVWSQRTFASLVWDLGFAGAATTSGSIYQPRARRVSVADGIDSDVVALADHGATSVWNSTGTAYHDEFEYRDPRVVYVPWDESWYVTLTRRTDDVTLAGMTALTVDNYDVVMFRLDGDTLQRDVNRTVPLYTRPRYEGACAAIADDGRQEILTIGSIELLSSNSNSVRNSRGLECRAMTSNGTTSPAQWTPPMVYSSSPIVLVTAGSAGTGDIDRPSAVFDDQNDIVLVAFTVVDPQGVEPTKVIAARVDAAALSVSEDLIEIGIDDDHGVTSPHVALDAAASEAIITYTLDAITATPRALGRFVGTVSGGPSASAIVLGPDDSGFPIARRESGRDRYVILCVTGYEAFGWRRSGSGLRIELLD